MVQCVYEQWRHLIRRDGHVFHDEFFAISSQFSCFFNYINMLWTPKTTPTLSAWMTSRQHRLRHLMRWQLDMSSWWDFRFLSLFYYFFTFWCFCFNFLNTKDNSKPLIHEPRHRGTGRTGHLFSKLVPASKGMGIDRYGYGYECRHPWVTCADHYWTLLIL